MKPFLLLAALCAPICAQTSTTTDLALLFRVPGSVACPLPLVPATCPTYPYRYPYEWVRVDAPLSLSKVGGVTHLGLASSALASSARVLYTSGNGGDIQRAIDALPAAGGEVVVDVDAAPAGSIEPRSNVTVRGVGGATITARGFPAFNVHDVSNVRIQDLNTTGGTQGVQAWNAPDLTVENVTMNGWLYQAVNIGANTPRLRVLRSRMKAAPGCFDGIFIQDAGPGVKVIGNTLDLRGCSRVGSGMEHGIALHTWSPGATMDAPEVSDNVIVHGGLNFPVEIGAFGGARIQGAIARNNRITNTAQSNGGISFDGVDAPVAEGNTVDFAGWFPLIAGVELVQSPGGRVANNDIHGAPAGVWPADSNALSIDCTSDTQVIANKLGGPTHVANSRAAGGFLEISRNTFALNTFADVAGGVKVWIQCNVAGCRADSNRFGLNVGLAEGDVLQEADHGTVTNTVFGSW